MRRFNNTQAEAAKREITWTTYSVYARDTSECLLTNLSMLKLVRRHSEVSRAYTL